MNRSRRSFVWVLPEFGVGLAGKAWRSGGEMNMDGDGCVLLPNEPERGRRWFEMAREVSDGLCGGGCKSFLALVCVIFGFKSVALPVQRLLIRWFVGGGD
ncbi:hypothetical protein L1987_33281 [Smallanthus sonchifolius]|uniref:Uncharacterized protein n=2 Tax=Smallanthus sonchifolius TaxID=185202 RepID=A0ACB9HQM4_9ASTR|nr:hypothetical protein L1987_33280 [Smallanthus sonchifolius]KAI3798015.1 hypothetical protein L1987_33281 [Smallanthus sonchifolius]